MKTTLFGSAKSLKTLLALALAFGGIQGALAANYCTPAFAGKESGAIVLRQSPSAAAPAVAKLHNFQYVCIFGESKHGFLKAVLTSPESTFTGTVGALQGTVKNYSDADRQCKLHVEDDGEMLVFSFSGRCRSGWLPEDEIQQIGD